MTIGMVLNKQEQTKLNNYLTEIERTRDTEITRVERNIISLKYKTEIIAPARKENAERRASRRQLRKESHASDLKWSASRPPRKPAIR